MPRLLLHSVIVFVLAACADGNAMELDERPAQPGEWGYRPARDSTSPVSPPAFSWRPQKGVSSWELEVTYRGKSGRAAPRVRYRVSGVAYNVHCPPEAFAPGHYSWRYRGVGKAGTTTWSASRPFRIDEDAVEMPLPAKKALIARVPTRHPRLFVRPEDMPRLRTLASGALRSKYDWLRRTSDKLLKTPPPTKEPPKYPKGMKRGSDPWRKIWWGNRRYVTAALNGAATLGFTRLLGGKEEYGLLAKRILLDCAKWDPKGSTGYRYNDEAGMPYNYYFSRTYTFVYDLLTDKERDACRRAMKIRGDEMYRHLHPRHLWKPYSSHSNRAWHFLGEIGIAFHGEVEGADEWVWFAANVFHTCYPVWSDSDGGWHEGMNYWRSYQGRFTWWADVMRAALGIDAFDKPYYSKIGYYPLYLTPPNKLGGGFGDLTARDRAGRNMHLVQTLAAQAGNGHWAWYVDRLGGPREENGYVAFVRGALRSVKPAPPTGLHPSRVFGGIGLAVLNTRLDNANESVQIVMKSSPFGTQSHGYESNNAFLLWAYGERLLIRSGRRDSYGSAHHRGWMWTTRSVNCVTVNGIGQLSHSAAARGEIVASHLGDSIDVAVGEAGGAYRSSAGRASKLERFTRTIVFVKPELVVVYDRLAARAPSTFEYWLHAVNEFADDDQHALRVATGGAACEIDLLTPEGLKLAQTNQYDPNPRPRIKLREWHLTASTTKTQRAVEFVALYRPHRKKDRVPTGSVLRRVRGGYELEVTLADGAATLLLPSDDHATLRSGTLRAKGGIAVTRRRDGRVIETVTMDR